MINGPWLLVLYLVIRIPGVVPGVKVPKYPLVTITLAVTPPFTTLIIIIIAKSGLNMALWIYWRSMTPTVMPSTIAGSLTGATPPAYVISWSSMKLHLWPHLEGNVSDAGPKWWEVGIASYTLGISELIDVEQHFDPAMLLLSVF